MVYSGRFVAENELGNGLCKLIIDHNDRIVGCHMLGNPASEIIVVAGIAIQRGYTDVYKRQVQILGDKYGNVIHLYERECSIQRRNQKVIEESPSPFVKPETRAKMLKVAVEACKRINYYSAGTLEFMMDKRCV